MNKNKMDPIVAAILFGSSSEGGGSDIEVEALSVTENGRYAAEEGKAYSPVNVNVPQITVEPLSVSENGTYTAASGKAYSPVEVNVTSSVNGIIYTEVNEEGYPTAVDLSNIKTTYCICANRTPNDGNYIHLQSAVIPDNITSIGENAFMKCSELTEVNLPSGITHIYTQAFLECSNLVNLNLPDSIRSIGNAAFHSCRKLRISKLPESLETIESSALAGCLMTDIIIPASVVTIGPGGLGYCKTLTSIEFKGTPSTISPSAFDSDINLTEIKVPWSEGQVANAPWGAVNATITYNYAGG